MKSSLGTAVEGENTVEDMKSSTTPYIAKNMLSVMALDQINTPSLLVYGEKDIVDKGWIDSLQKKLKNSDSSSLMVSEGTALSHLGPNRNDYMEKINAFLTNVDNTI